MDIFSVSFALFFLTAYILYYTLMRRKQWVVLVVANLVFYAFSGWKNLIFILITSFSVWGGALAMERFALKAKERRKEPGLGKEEKDRIKADTLRKKRLVLLAVLLLNFGILAFFKYWNGVLKLLGLIFNTEVQNWTLFHGASALLLPLGISFYTFQSVGYCIDIYGGKYAAEKNPLKYLLFVSYFPALIQGPINRYDSLAPQFQTTHRTGFSAMRRSLLLFAWGAVKKFALANLLSGAVSLILDHVEPETPGCMIVTGILLYGIQQYADFSGGIDMVLALSDAFGIRMAENFRQPYFSVSLGDFWRRWHISLGAWMRDYVFYPFALTKLMQGLGKRVKKRFGPQAGSVIPACVANILVFFIVGIWHGAQWHYIAWGLYNGLVIAAEDLVGMRFSFSGNSKGLRFFRMARTFLIVNIGWYFDRILDVKCEFTALKNTLFSFQPSAFLPGIRELYGSAFNEWTVCIAAVAFGMLLVTDIMKECGKDVRTVILESNPAFRWAVYFLIFYLIQFGLIYGTATEGFMYAFF
ncbi:MAG: MBOAT family protein [Lachnospiraceae bacterium]|nr:MBOAT family protein [Lachnospiraceae bacterium]